MPDRPILLPLTSEWIDSYADRRRACGRQTLAPVPSTRDWRQLREAKMRHFLLALVLCGPILTLPVPTTSVPIGASTANAAAPICAALVRVCVVPLVRHGVRICARYATRCLRWVRGTRPTPPRLTPRPPPRPPARPPHRPPGQPGRTHRHCFQWVDQHAHRHQTSEQYVISRRCVRWGHI